MRPDFNTEVVQSPLSGSPMHFSWMPDLQPDEPNTIHALLAEKRWVSPVQGLRKCVKQDGVWIDKGPAPDLRDESWHPDLPDYLAHYVAISRKVIASIPHCHSIHTILSAHRSGGEDEISSAAMFYRQSRDNPSEIRGILDDRYLDQFPDVRYVERGGIPFKDHFNIKIYDDGSGYEGDLDIEISLSALKIEYKNDDEEYISLRSVQNDGWFHETIIALAEPEEEDPIEILRSLKSDESRFQSILTKSSFNDVYAEPLRRNVRCLSMEEKDHLLIFSIEPGSLLSALHPVLS